MPLLTCPTCRVQLDIPAELVGRQVKCSECATVLDPRDMDRPPRSPERGPYRDDRDRPRRRDDYAREDEYGLPPAGGKKPKRGRTIQIVCLIGGLCLLLLVGLVIFFGSAATHQKREDLTYIPEQTALVGRVRVKDFDHIPETKNLGGLLQKAMMLDPNAREAGEAIGVLAKHLKNVDEIFYAVAPESPNQVPGFGLTVIIHANKAYTTDEVGEILNQMNLTQVRKQSIRGLEVRQFVPADQADRQRGNWFRNQDDAFGLCLLDEKTILFADMKTLRDSLRPKYEPMFDDRLQGMVDTKELEKRSVYVAVNLLAFDDAPAEAPDTFVVSADITKKKVTGNGELTYPSAQIAQQRHIQFQNQFGMFQLGVGMFGRGSKSLRAVVNGLKVNVDGRKLKGTYEVPSADLNQAILDAQGLVNNIPNFGGRLQGRWNKKN